MRKIFRVFRVIKDFGPEGTFLLKLHEFRAVEAAPLHIDYVLNHSITVYYNSLISTFSHFHILRLRLHHCLNDNLPKSRASIHHTCSIPSPCLCVFDPYLIRI